MSDPAKGVSTLRRKVGRGLRHFGLLQAADDVRFWLRRAQSARRDWRVRREHPEQALPPAYLTWDAYGHLDYDRYWDTGLETARFFAEKIRAFMPEARNVYEWGCGPARIIRHLPAALPQCRFFGSDYNPATIAWCRAHIRGVEFAENRLAPPLPYADGAFDIVYNVSVFTHLSAAMHDAWIAELARILCPGGLLMFTLQGDAKRGEMYDDERAAYDRGALVVRGRVEEGKKAFAAFQPPAWVRRHLLAGFEILAHEPTPISAIETQDLWLARCKA